MDEPTVPRAGVVGLYAAGDQAAEDETGATGTTVAVELNNLLAKSHIWDIRCISHLQELVVAAQTGYESVHGQSVMVL